MTQSFSLDQDLITFLNAIVDQTDPILTHYFEALHLKVDQKEDGSPVTDADRKIEETVQSICQEYGSTLAVVGEEFGHQGPDDAIRVIVDPIDGTRNLVKGIPIVGTLIGIEHCGEVLAGMVSNPILKQRWVAAKGKGAFYNGKPIKVSDVGDLSQSQAFHGSLSGSEATAIPDSVWPLLKDTHRQRGVGDFYMHCLVAMGAGEFAVDAGLKPWDIAPFPILLSEAGGKCSDFLGNTSIYSGSLISSNKALYQTVFDRITAT